MPHNLTLAPRRWSWALYGALLAVIPGLPAVADDESNVPTHYVDNDGSSSLILRTPAYQLAANPRHHVGMAVKGTRVRVLQERADSSLPVFKWSQVRILSGDLKGKSGWVSSNTLVRLSSKEIERFRVRQKSGAGGRSGPDSAEFYVLDNSGDRTLIVKQPVYTAAADRGQHVALAPVATPVAILEKQQDKALRILSWYKVRVLSGPHEGKIGWVTSNTIRSSPATATLIVASTSSPQDAHRGRVARDAEIEVSAAVDLLDPLTLKCEVDAGETAPSRYVFEMRKKGAGQDAWQSIGDSTASTLEYKTLAPGRFDVRAYATWRDSRKVHTQVETVEVRYPSRSEILADSDLQTAMWDEWVKTYDRFLKTGVRREYGFRIRIDTRTERFVIVDRAEGKPAKPGEVPSVSLGTIADPSDGPLGPGQYTVADFHTHTPLRGLKKERPFGPGKNDRNPSGRYLVGLVFDFAKDQLSPTLKAKMRTVTRADVTRYFGRLSTIKFATGRDFEEIALGVLAQKEPTLDMKRAARVYAYGPERRRIDGPPGSSP